MKHKTPGVTDELLLRAREEFLREGFQGANLRKIAMAAGVSTNSIYVRFADKKGLFDALVRETADELYNMIADMTGKSGEETDMSGAMEKSGQYTIDTLDYIYDHFDIFKLIFCKSAGTEYEHYIDRLSALEEETYRSYLDKMGLTGKVSDLFIHMVSESGYRYLTETVAHDLTREEAHRFMSEVIIYMEAGLEAVLEQ